ncbi:MAG TPA: tetratricopeptide repeat-containing protein [Xanthobacteraceae bacterium]|nr:tetratricopeptide repeat-containing protein [Xanthobacteraceae bacterium]
MIPADIETALRVGDYFRAYDLATAALEAEPGDLDLHYVAVLALARTGANKHARACLRAILDSIKSGKVVSPQLAEDFAAMDARLAKDLALEEIGQKRRTLAADSARRYEAALAVKGGHFPAINAATMWLLAGETEKSRALARRALDDIRHTAAGYWPLASAAEAHLLLGELPEARRALAAATASSATDLADQAVTRRQMALVCETLGVSWASIDVAPTSTIVHFCGDDVDDTSSGLSSDLSCRIDQLIADRPIALAFGAIRNRMELLIAEKLLARGVDVQLVLPTDAAAIAEAIGGDGRRVQACVDKLHSPALVMSSSGQTSRALFAHSARCAMGLAIMRADALLMDARQIAISCANDASRDSADLVDHWSGLGRPQAMIEAPKSRPRAMRASSPPCYETKAFVFCDIKGFSKIPEEAMPAFVNVVLGGLAEEIDKFKTDVEYRETAGDGIYLVFRGVAAAADCALALVARLNGLPPGPLSRLGIRVSAHVGAVFSATDPVTGFRKFFGSEIIRAARIEPITPVGECYVTEQFASIIALEASHRLNCDYAGVLASAKEYGAFRMYSLRRRKMPDQL